MTEQAYDPDTTPGTGLGVGQSWAHPAEPPMTPTPQGETLLDADGKVRHIPAREDGRPVALSIGTDEEA